jgi:pyruvate,water dikinase
MAAIADLTFEAPGPGSWEIDATHVPRPWARFQTEMHSEQLARGFRETGRRYGLVLDYLDWRLVNGLAYSCPRIVAPEEIPARAQAAAAAFEAKLWREDMRRWEEQDKPAAVRAHLALQAIDPSTLTMPALLEHLERCVDHLQRMIYQHHWYNGAAMVPVGDFLVHAAQWTSLPHGELLALFRGSAPTSAGVSAERERMVQAIRDDPEARALLSSDREPADVLEALRSRAGDVGAAVGEYIDMVGYRLLDGLEVGELYALEKPEVLVTAIRSAVDGADAAPGGADGLSEETPRIRALVPPAEREHFDELLAEARHTYGLRDERGVFSEVWAAGITRRVILEAGRRLAEQGRIERAEHLLDTSYDEMRQLIADAGGPSAQDLRERAELRSRVLAEDAPRLLGPAPGPPPPLDALPAPAARAMGAFMTVIQALFGDSDAASEPRLVRGLGASPGSYEGTARVIAGPAEFGRLVQGDVLVTRSTTEAFNIVLPVLGAIVTDAGGVLSHAAIVSREFGIPGVVGCRCATATIPDGARVRVDGGAGEVALVG